MRFMLEAWESIQIFLQTGGPVLKAIGVLALVMWVLIMERVVYLAYFHRQRVKRVMAEWSCRAERGSWYARQIRAQLLSETRRALVGPLPFIKTLVSTCPLLGLMGTVMGMIEVFHVMALVGSGNARAMAGGVSMATIPTMAGMVVAIAGLYVVTRLDRSAKKRMTRLTETMIIERGAACAAG
jgi:biopolymer transport protein ExbB